MDRRNIGGTTSIIDNHSKLEICKLDVKKLDDLNIDKNKIKFIKMDVEGNELSVIIGAKKILSNLPIKTLGFSTKFETSSINFSLNLFLSFLDLQILLNLEMIIFFLFS